MIDREQLRSACKQGIKAAQNVRAAHLGFERLCSLVESSDDILLGSMFHFGVVRYAKPFISSKSEGGTVRYSVSRIKDAPNFSREFHDHLIDIRNTLIAHDDFIEVEPRLLATTMSVTPDVENKSTVSIPTSVTIANKCVSHPADLATAQKFSRQAEAALNGIIRELHRDVTAFRDWALKHPNEANDQVRYEARYGSTKVEPGGTHVTSPDVSDDPFLNVDEPNFREIHDGFRYERFQCRFDFNGPERITLPNGATVEIRPRTESNPK